MVHRAHDFIADLNAERERHGITKEQLAKRCGIPGASMRRLFTRGASDVKMSTVEKIADALGISIELKKVDSDVSPKHRGMLMERIKRRSLAERLADQSGFDVGDIEHSLYNLTLTPTERLMRRFRGKHVLERR
jgi:transcriptional regulator with XRE-family HTH domain